jgi:hypothetical protein
MALIFMDGFDKYGPLNMLPLVPIFCKNGTAFPGHFAIAAGLSSPGSAVNIGSSRLL